MSFATTPRSMMKQAGLGDNAATLLGIAMLGLGGAGYGYSKGGGVAAAGYGVLGGALGGLAGKAVDMIRMNRKLDRLYPSRPEDWYTLYN